MSHTVKLKYQSSICPDFPFSAILHLHLKELAGNNDVLTIEPEKLTSVQLILIKPILNWQPWQNNVPSDRIDRYIYKNNHLISTIVS